MGRAEQVAKLEALLERVQQRAHQPRANESGAVEISARGGAIPSVSETRVSEAPTARPMAMPYQREVSPPERLSSPGVPTPSPRPAAFPTPLPRRTPSAPRPFVDEIPRPRPSSPSAAVTPSHTDLPRVAAPVSLDALDAPLGDALLDAIPGDSMLEDVRPAPAPTPRPSASEIAAAAPSDAGLALPPVREPQLTPTAQLLAPIAASEKPRVRVNPEMTAPVSAEEVAAAAAAMNRVPTFPDSWPVEASATKAAAAAAAVRESAPGAFEAPAAAGIKDAYLDEEDADEPTKPLAHPPRIGAPKAATQLEAETARKAQDVAAAPPAFEIKAPAPFEPFPKPEVPASKPGGVPASVPSSPRAMVVPREVEAPFLSNLRQDQEKKKSSGLVWLLLLIVIAAGGYAAYTFGYLKPHDKKELPPSQ